MSQINKKELLKKEIAALKRKYKKYLEMWDDSMLFNPPCEIIQKNIHLTLKALKDRLAEKEARLKEF